VVGRSRQRRRYPPYTQPFAAVSTANDVWCTDFKGWFRTGDGRRCDPFTLTDAHSRYLLRCRVVARPDEENVRPIFEAAFQEHGLPLAIRSDNGPPFASPGVGGLSRLAVWWIKLGIRPERIVAGRPQQNGRHERVHRTLKQETATPAAASLPAQQQRFDGFRAVYNKERPHEALGQQTPASLYRASPRPYPDRVEDPHYGEDVAVRRVRSNGQIKWAGELIFVGEALIGEPVGILETEGGDWLVRYANVELGYIHPQRRRLSPRPLHGGPGRPVDLMELADAITTTPQAQQPQCESAWNKDPVFGVIGIQSGPPGRRVHSGFRGGCGGQVGDAGSGDDCEDPSRVFRSEEANQDDLPRASGVAEGRAQGDPIAGDRVSL
jgi:hypothetical protein